MNTTKIGREAEDFVANYLEQYFGWKLMHKNWRTRSCEIDLIMRCGDIVHFIEVKFRKNNFAGGGLAAINPAKLRRMANATLEWFEANPTESSLQPNLVAIEVGLDTLGELQIREVVDSIQT